MKLFSIPNLFTLGNLLCGCLAIVFAFEGNLVWSAYLVGVAAVFDFLDGFLARKLNQHSPIGKELDSLADMVTFGVVPGVVMFKLLVTSYYFENYQSILAITHKPHEVSQFGLYSLPICACGFIISLFSALRLAKFNIDTRQSESFIGVPTPAVAIIICSLPLAIWQLTGINFSSPFGFVSDYNFVMFGGIMNSSAPGIVEIVLNKWVLIGFTGILSFLLISEIPLFALKFKTFGWKGNEIRWSFLAACVILLATLQFVGIPLTIVLYILMSVISNLVRKKS